LTAIINGGGVGDVVAVSPLVHATPAAATAIKSRTKGTLRGREPAMGKIDGAGDQLIGLPSWK
jgi:alkaline phosphatase